MAIHKIDVLVNHNKEAKVGELFLYGDLAEPLIGLLREGIMEVAAGYIPESNGIESLSFMVQGDNNQIIDK